MVLETMRRTHQATPRCSILAHIHCQFQHPEVEERPVSWNCEYVVTSQPNRFASRAQLARARPLAKAATAVGHDYDI